MSKDVFDAMEWIVRARGHPNITAKHRTTFMLTKDEEVGGRGDCVVGIGANKAAVDLDPELKAALRSGKEVSITISSGGISVEISAWGDAKLSLDDPREIVVRKSDFISGRTVAVKADKAAKDFSPELVKALADPSKTVEMKIRVFP